MTHSGVSCTNVFCRVPHQLSCRNLHALVAKSEAYNGRNREEPNEGFFIARPAMSSARRIKSVMPDIELICSCRNSPEALERAGY